MMSLKHAIAAAALLALSACGSGGNEGVTLTKAIVGGLAPVVGLGGKSETPARPALTRAQIDASAAPLLLAEVPSLGGSAIMTPLAANGAKVTWRSQDGKALILQAGYLIATKALGEDVVATEVEGFGSAISPQGGVYTRQMEWLTGRNQVRRASFTCTVTPRGAEVLTIYQKAYKTTAYDDRCEGDGVIFTNKYWIDSGRKLRQSRQWVSKSVGYLQTQAL